MNLNIGDRVMITHWPEDLDRSTCHPETIAFYESCIAERYILVVNEYDPFGLPFARIEFIVDGLMVSHGILLNHGAVVRVE